MGPRIGRESNLSVRAGELEQPARWLKPNRGCRVPSSLLLIGHSVDTTIDGRGSRVETWNCAYAIHLRREKGKWTRRKECKLKSPSALWEYIRNRLNPKSPLYLVAANCGTLMTCSGFWELLENRIYWPQWCTANDHLATGDECHGRKAWRGSLVISDPPIIISVRSKLGTLKIHDIANWFRLNPHARAPWDYSRDVIALPQTSQASVAQLQARLQAECLEQYTCSAMDEWEQSESGCWQPTAGGLAWSSFKHTVKPKTILVNHSPDVSAIERAAYYGGQCEAYFVGSVDSKQCISRLHPAHQKAAVAASIRGPVYILDIRSMYPACLHSCPYPVRFHEWGRDLACDAVSARLDVQCAAADVLLDSTISQFPVRRNGRLLFPVGAFRTCLAGPELLRALRIRAVQNVYRVAWYYSGKPFRPFVEKWWEQRQKARLAGDEARESFCKLVSNCLAGYLGRHRHLWRDDLGTISPVAWGRFTRSEHGSDAGAECRAIAGWTQSLSGLTEGRESLPAMAAYCTSYARERMTELRRVAGLRGTIYQDTDSLIVTQAGFNRLNKAFQIVGEGLGALRLVGKADRAEIHAQKDYSLDDHCIISGVPIGSVRTGPGTFDAPVRQRLAGICRIKPEKCVRVDTIKIALTRDYSPRAVGPDGWTMPIILREDVPF